MDTSRKTISISNELSGKIFTSPDRLEDAKLQLDQESRNQRINASHIQTIVDRKLAQIAADDYKNVIQLGGHTLPREKPAAGRLGLEKVSWDLSTNVGSLLIDEDRLGLASHSGFSSIKGNSAVYSGRWMYEIQLNTRGVAQVGWATATCKFSQERGVGDTENSYAYDGNRQRKWNINTFKYGDQWNIGDVIGVALDADLGKVEFFRNGRSLGLAFGNVRLGPGYAYFPAVSLAFNESLVANFGHTPFKYSQPDYSPLELMPRLRLMYAYQLTDWFSNITKEISLIKQSSTKDTLPNSSSSQFQEKMVPNFLLSYPVLRSLAPILAASAYAVEAFFLPSLLDMNQDQVASTLDTMWSLLETPHMSPILESVVRGLVNGYRYAGHGTANSDRNDSSESSHMQSDDLQSGPLKFVEEKRYLTTLLYLVRHGRTRIYLLKHILFDKSKFPAVFDLKSFDDRTLASDIFPNMTIYSILGEDSVGSLRNSYVAEQIQEVENVQRAILYELISDSVSQMIFMTKLASFVKEAASMARRNVLTPSFLSMCPPTTILSFFMRLTHLMRTEYEPYVTQIPVGFFLDSSLVSPDVIRMGGLVSHLQKAYQTDLNAFDSPLPTSTNCTPAVMSEEATHSPFLSTRSFSSLVLAGQLKNVFRIIDMLFKLYTVEAHKQLGKLISVRDSLQEYQQALEDLQELDATSATSSFPQDIASDPLGLPTPVHKSKRFLNILERGHSSSMTSRAVDITAKVLQSQFLIHARQCAWINSSVLTHEKLGDILWLLKLMLNTLERGSSSGNVFAFIPDYYLECLLSLCQAARFHFNVSGDENFAGPVREEYKRLLRKFAQFIASHFNDDRVANAELKDNLAQALASLVSNPETLQSLETIGWSYQCKMIRALTAPYENRAWAQSNWILLRFWKGNGFAYRYQVPPNMLNRIGNPHNVSKDSTSLNYLKPCPSSVFQQVLVSYLTGISTTLDDLPGTSLHSLVNRPRHDSEYQFSASPPASTPVQIPIINTELSETGGHTSHATQFILSVLSQLNWSFSEFIGMLQEIQNAANRPEKVFLDSRQLKICTTCYDLTLALLRVLEMICTLTPHLITSSTSSDMILPQLVAMICQILNRITVRTGCFDFVTQLDIPGLESVAHFPILAAVSGILVALSVKCGSENSRSTAIKALVGDASFVLKSLYFLVGRDEEFAAAEAPIPSTSADNDNYPPPPPPNTTVPPIGLDIPPALAERLALPPSLTGALSTNSTAPPTTADCSPTSSHGGDEPTQTEKKKERNTVRFNLADYEEVSAEELKEIHALIATISDAHRKHEMEYDEEKIDEEDLCTICYANGKCATFVPCGHVSCKSCISLHFLRHSECFFCKANIERVTFKDNEEVLYPKNASPSNK